MPVFRLQSDAVFPDPELAENNGLIGIGGDLSQERLIAAYSTGIFPWYSEGQPILWFSPDPRMVLKLEDFKLSKSLDRMVKSKKFEVKIDTAFKKVIQACSINSRKDQDGTWITQAMIGAYETLHQSGIAHSFETYKDGLLVGGLYGVSLGRGFFGESMFYKERDASKVAFASLVAFCSEHGFDFIDAQTPSKHLASLGAKEIPRRQFLDMLRATLERDSLLGDWGNI